MGEVAFPAVSLEQSIADGFVGDMCDDGENAANPRDVIQDSTGAKKGPGTGLHPAVDKVQRDESSHSKRLVIVEHAHIAAGTRELGLDPHFGDRH